MGFLGNAGVISSYVKVTNTKPVVVRSFYLMNGRTCPVAYRGSFSWSLLKDSELKTYGECKTSTFLEFYMAVTPPAKLWPSYGISVNLLRQYLPAWGLYNGGWGAADFYRYITQVIINGGEFVFDNVNGDARYAFSGFGISYKLDKYLQELESGKAERINSYDMAGIMQIILSLFPNYDQVSWNYMRPYGWINTTK
jgi:hypothetical protein